MTALILTFPGARVTEPDPAAPTCLIGRRPHPATDGLLCRHHLEELGRWLHDIEDEAARISAVPRMEAVRGPGGSSLASHRSPAVLDAIAYLDPRTTEVGHRHHGPTCASWRCPHVSCWDIRSDRDEHESGGASLVHVVSVLHGWADQTRDERRLGPLEGEIRTHIAGPDGRLVGEWLRTGPIPPTVMSERLLLTRQLGWIAGRPWVADMRRSIRDLRAQLLKLNRNDDDQPLPGWCFRLVDGHECRGNLWPTEPAYSSATDPVDLDGPNRPRAVVCDRDPTHRWEAKNGEIARLTLIVQAQRRKDAAS